MQFVKDILEDKGYEVVSASPDTSICNATMMVKDRGISSILIVENDELKGIFTERELAHQIANDCSASVQTAVSEVMISPVNCVKPSQTINACMVMMTEKAIRHLPVIADNKIVGIVSIGDLVKAVITEQQFVIEQLEQYIAS